MEKPTLPKGTRDFGPLQMARREYIFQTIRSVFQLYGFQPIETPAMENLSTLTGKYGEEGDQLLFKVLNSGDFLKDIDRGSLTSIDSKILAPQVAEKGLRYDLTVPFARYVVMDRHDITFPFKRYQIQPVWRADRPQKGRYREFYQCDADVIGTDSLTCEAEIILMIKAIFKRLGISDYSIKLNHRGILAGLASAMHASGKEGTLFVAIDKLDKIGEEAVRAELTERGFDTKAIDQLFHTLALKGSNQEKLDMLNKSFADSPGVKDVRAVLQLLSSYGDDEKNVEFDISLARGLSYYTGCIFEVKVHGVAIGSVSGGGRYDNLTAIFDAREKSSGVGISFGVDRIYDVMDTLNLFPERAQATSDVLTCHLDEASSHYAIRVAATLRNHGISAEVYPDPAKLKKQLEYADKKKTRFVVVIGEDEMRSGQLTVKEMKTGTQEKMKLDELIRRISDQN